MDRIVNLDMPEEKVKAILLENVQRGDLSKLIVDLLLANFEVVNAAREHASREAGKRYFKATQDENRVTTE